MLLPSVALAQVVITEIMYDPAGVDSGHEWIEIYNESTSSIPLTTWKLYEGDANHNIIAASGDSMIASGTYAVIATNAAKFRSDVPNFSGELFHSAFSLDNGGATLTLRDKSLTDIDTVSYNSARGGLGDGNSLQRAPYDTGEFFPRTPTPGAAIATTTIAPKTSLLSPAKTPQKKKSSSKSITSKAVPSSSASPAEGLRPRGASNDAGNMAIVSPQTATATGSSIGLYWYVALGSILVLAVGAIAVSRHAKKDEWDIIEETSEEV